MEKELLVKKSNCMDDELKDILSKMKNSLSGIQNLYVDCNIPFSDVDDAISIIVKVENGK